MDDPEEAFWPDGNATVCSPEVGLRSSALMTELAWLETLLLSLEVETQVFDLKWD